MGEGMRTTNRPWLDTLLLIVFAVAVGLLITAVVWFATARG